MDKLTSKRGMMMLLSLFVVAFSGLYVTVGMTRAVTETRISRQFLYATNAFHLAESAIDETMRRLSTNTTLDLLTIDGNAPPLINLQQNGTAWITDVVDERLLDPPVWRFTARGRASGVEKKVAVVVQMPVVTPPSNGFGTVFGTSSVKLTEPNIVIDAYDSNALGDYTLSSRIPASTGTPLIRTNLTSGSDIIKFENDSGIEVHGHIYLGPGGSGNCPGDCGGRLEYQSGVVISPWAGAPWGGMVPTYWNPALSVPAVTPPSSAGCVSDPNQSSGELVLTAPGTYCYDSFTLQGTSRLRTSGTGTITINVPGSFDMNHDAYITGPSTTNVRFVVNGSFALNTTGTLKIDKDATGEGDPTKLRFDLSGTSSATLQAQGGGEKLTVYGVIYAPNRPLDINGGGGEQVEIFGGLIGNNVKINADSAKIHADVALNGVGRPPPPPPPGSVTKPTQKMWRAVP